jgi:hypothetical protein
MVATVLGVARLPRPRRVLGAAVVLILSVVLTAFAGPWRWAPRAVDLWYQDPVPQVHVDALRDAVALVPDDAPVSATNKAGSHLAARRYIYAVPVLGRARWILLDTRDQWVVLSSSSLTPSLDPELLRAFRRRIEQNSNWAAVFDRDGVLVFRRASTQ